MSSKIIRARRFLDRVEIDVHLDTTKTVPGPPAAPDPAWVIHMSWPLPTDWATRSAAERTAWQNSVKAEVQTTTATQLAIVTDETSGGTVLPFEGTVF